MSSEQQVDVERWPADARGTGPAGPAAGLVAVLTREVGSYKDFLSSFRRLAVPPGTEELLLSNGEKVASRNLAVDALLSLPSSAEWLYFLDDDHKFPRTILYAQLARAIQYDVDVLGALYCTRVALRDTYPVGGIFQRSPAGALEIRNLTWADLPAQARVLERPDLTMGTAGLLIRRRVLEALPAPAFQVGQIHPGKEFEDLYFVIRCQEAGFRVGMNLAEPLGHTTRITLWPRRDEAGDWHVLGDQDPPFADRMRGHRVPRSLVDVGER
jgi:hypothetical protein